MIQKLPTFLLLFFAYHITTAQSNRVLIFGEIKNASLNPIANTHIVNLTTKVGAVSNKNGAFNIPVKEGDWLQISNIQFITKKVKIKKGNLNERVLLIYLMPVKNVLDEAIIKKKMKGVLSLDRKDKAKDSLPRIDQEYYNFSTMNFSNVKVDKNKPKSAQYLTDPVAKFAGLPPVSIGLRDRALEAKRAVKRDINFKESFPNKLKQLFGAQFFFDNLKIPKDNYYHFLQYCNPLGIERLFKDEKHLEILKILLKESKSYLLLLENNK
ncbi:MAG: hypothetical protein ACI9SI_001795 [Polaribacter sp.]|jgi:hypothetical protein